MMEFWLISVPLDKISCQSLEKLKRVAAKSGLATSSRLHVPELKVREPLLLLLLRLEFLNQMGHVTVASQQIKFWEY